MFVVVALLLLFPPLALRNRGSSPVPPVPGNIAATGDDDGDEDAMLLLTFSDSTAELFLTRGLCGKVIDVVVHSGIKPEDLGLDKIDSRIKDIVRKAIKGADDSLHKLSIEDLIAPAAGRKA